MLETYKVGVTLELGGNVQTGIDRLIQQMERLQSTVNDAGGAFRKLSDAADMLGMAGRSAQSLNRAMAKLGDSGGGVANMERMATAAKSMQTASEQLTTALRDNAKLSADMAKSAEAAAAALGRGGRGGGGGAGRSSGGGGHGGSGGHDWAMLGLGSAMVGEPLLRGSSNAFERGLAVAHMRAQILADRRVSPAQADAMVNSAYAATQTAPGTRVTGNLGALIDLKQVTGSLQEAEKLLPRFARLTALLQVMDRRKGGDGDAAFAAAKAMEIMGGMVEEHTDASGHTVREINPDLMQKRLDMIARVSVATNARIGPEDYLKFARQARVAGMTLSDDFIYQRLPAIMLGMGGARAGTALMSMAQVFEGGKLTVKSMEALEGIGLAGPGGLTKEGGHKNRHGVMVGGHWVVHPDAIFDLAMMRTDPDKFTLAAQTRMEAAGIHGTANQIVALMTAAQRSTIAGALADFLKDAPVIAKEQQNILATRPDVATYFAQQDPAAKLQQMQAAFDKLVTTLGSSSMDDAVKLMNAATAGLNSLSAWAEKNPGFARVLTDTAAGLGAVATALGTLSTAIFLFGPALRALGVVTGGGGAARAAVAASGGGIALPAALLTGGGIALALHEENAFAPGSSAALDLAAGASAHQHRMMAPHFATAAEAEAYDRRPMTVQLHGDVTLDGRKVGTVVGNGIAKSGSGPSQGTTGFDTRTGLVGGMNGTP